MGPVESKTGPTVVQVWVSPRSPMWKALSPVMLLESGWSFKEEEASPCVIEDLPLKGNLQPQDYSLPLLCCLFCFVFAMRFEVCFTETLCHC